MGKERLQLTLAAPLLPYCVVAGTQTHSEYGADRAYTGETYAQRVQSEQLDGVVRAPPSALRRSLSSKVGGLGLAQEETPAKLRRKVSWAGNTVRGAAWVGTPLDVL